MNFKKKSVWTTLGALVLAVSLFAVSAVIGAYVAPSAAEDKPVGSIISPATSRTGIFVADGFRNRESAIYLFTGEAVVVVDFIMSGN